MFVGHYAIGLLFKKRLNEIPLWLLFIAVQFVDIIAFILVLLGIEKISYNPSSNPFLRTSIDYVVYSHSLLGNTLIALLVFLIFWRYKNVTWGWILGGAVLSHWVIDFISHTADMPLINDNFKIGLGLWLFPWPAFLIEIGCFIGAGYYLYRNTKNSKRPTILILLAILLYSPTMFAPEGEAPVTVVCITSLGLYGLFAALAYWAEKNQGLN